MKIILNDFIEGVRAMAGLPASNNTMGYEAGGSRFDRVIMNLGESEARQMVLERGVSGGIPVTAGCDISWRSCGEGEFIGTLPLPSDLLLPVGVRLLNRIGMLTGIIMPEDSDHWQRYSSYPEIAGSVSSPRLYMVEGTGGRYIEVHRSNSSLFGAELTYLRNPVWDNGTMEFPEGEESTLIWRTAKQIRELLK